MGLALWIGLFVISSLFWAWVIFGAGADWLEGSWLAAVFIHVRAMEWNAETIRLCAGLMWLAEGIWFAIGLFVPHARLFLL